MDDVWFAAGLTRGDLDLCVKALALQNGDRSPLIAVASRNADGPRLVLASRALFGLFGVDSGEALARRLLEGQDQGARRLAALQDTLPLGGAPRLERLRFSLGQASEAITFLCRRVRLGDGASLFIAAALNVRAGLLPVPPAAPPAAVAPLPEQASMHDTPATGSTAEVEPDLPADVGGPEAATTGTVRVAPAEALPDGPLDIQAIHAALRQRWPSRRSLRFLWQSDADGLCTQVSPLLGDIVGTRGADLVGIDLFDLARRLDPKGALEAALLSRETWSGIAVDWPIDDAPAAVAVVLGAIPALDGDRTFAGYRGYGIVKLDELVARDVPPADTAGGTTGQVIAFPAKALSTDDERAFSALAADLRSRAGLGQFHADTQTFAIPLEPAATSSHPEPTPGPGPVTVPAAVPVSSAAARDVEVARNGLSLVDRLALGVLVSRDNVPIFANRHFLDLTGFSDEDALHAAGGLQHLFGHSPGNASGAEAVAVRRSDGSTIIATARMQRIDWDGLPATLLTLQAEPRGTKPAVASSRDDERSDLRAILETATDGVIVMDAECRVLSLNRAGEALFGRDRGEVLGKPFLDLFAAHDQTLARDYLEGVKSDPARSLLNDGREFLVTAAQGGTIPVFMTLGRLGQAGETAASPPGRFCALFRDLTHWKKVEGELDDARRAAERASALKSDFLAKVSHEIRTPLNAIIGFAEVMMEERFGPLGNARYKDYLGDIHGSGTHVMSLVNDLLDLSKIEAGKMELARIPLDANRIVSDCVALMQPQASRERVILRLSLAANLPRICSDERSLRQIALNLLSNAVKFNEPGGQVIVATQLTEAGTVVLRIRDTGPGMSETDVAAALEPFRQLAPQREASGMAGTGLGLPLTKALVEANDATLTIRSKVDQGTFVEVAFPIARVLAGD